MIGWWGSKFLSMTFGVMYPAYSSYKAIKTIEKEDDIQWLCYWVIFGLFTFIEFFLDIVLMWVPLYQELKLAFIIWLALPQTKGALFVWQRSKDTIDKWLIKVEEQVGKITAQATTAAESKPEEKKDS
mmetsp:Transcript_21840/g.34228  ORF Transcript_21840/g.34228 Transcript_21840/m.34228 type:complete len:128 (+) Transcript_21840:174-557(+)